MHQPFAIAVDRLGGYGDRRLSGATPPGGADRRVLGAADVHHRAPRLEPRTVWRLDVSLVCATVIRVVGILSTRESVSWGLHPSPPRQEVGIGASFVPDDWNGDRVRVGFGALAVTVEDPLLKNDPRGEVAVLAPEVTTTGTVVPVAEVGDHGITAAVLMLDVLDCEDRRMDRWRVRPALRDMLPPFLSEVTSGRQSGTAAAPGSGLGWPCRTPFTPRPPEIQGGWRRS